MPWPVEFDGWRYKPIPESWIDHPNAVDHDSVAPPDAVRLFAVSVGIAPNGRIVKIRYLHPKGGKVRCLWTSSCSGPQAGKTRVPCSLRPPYRHAWPRSYVPSDGEEPDDVAREEEREHFGEVWADKLTPHGDPVVPRGEPA